MALLLKLFIISESPIHTWESRYSLQIMAFYGDDDGTMGGGGVGICPCLTLISQYHLNSLTLILNISLVEIFTAHKFYGSKSEYCSLQTSVFFFSRKNLKHGHFEKGSYIEFVGFQWM